MEFEFDPAKSASNKQKHGIDFDEAQAIWRDTGRIEGPARSDGEQRHMLVGMIDGKLWSAVYTTRGSAIRLISVRRSRGYEIAHYFGE